MKSPVIRKKLGRGRPKLKPNWILETKFPNGKSAVDHLSAEEIWSIDYCKKYSDSGGCKVYYRCNRVKINKTRCSVIKYLLISNNTDEVWLYKSKPSHNHDKTNKKYHFSNAEIRKMDRPQKESDRLEEKPDKTLTQNYISGAQNRFNKWIFENTFDVISEAKSYINQQKIWSFKYQNHSAVGLAFYYRCNLVPKIGPQCAAQKYFLINRKTSKVTMYQRDCPHTHNDIKKPLNNTMSDLRTKTDCLLKRLYKTDRDIILKRGFRVLQAVRLRDCHFSQISSGTSLRIDDNELKTKNICKKRFENPHFSSDWIFEKKFPKEKMALEYIAKEAIWEIDSSKVYSVIGGHKIHYQCNQMMVNDGPKCAAWKCLFYFADSEDVSVYKKNNEHTHDAIALQFRKKQKVQSTKRKRGRPPKSARYDINKSESINQPVSGLDISNNRHPASMELVTGDDSTQYIINYIADDQISCEDKQEELDPAWVYKKSFIDSEQAMRFLDERNWINFKTSTIRFQTRIYYCCKIITNSGSPCKAQIYISRCTETNRILVYRNLTRHSHPSTKKIKKRNIPLPTGILKKIQRSETERAVISFQSEGINELITPDEFIEIKSDIDKCSLDDTIPMKDTVFENNNIPSSDSSPNSNFIVKEELIITDESVEIAQTSHQEENRTIRSSLSIETNTIFDSVTTPSTSEPKIDHTYAFRAEKNSEMNKNMLYEYQFTLKEKVANIIEAKNKMKQESTNWVSSCIKQFEYGYRQMFRCNYSNTFETCSCRVLLIVKNNSDEVLLYYNSCPHVHGNDLSDGGITKIST